jgi:hypothetical protein
VKVANQVIRLPSFYDYIVYVCLNGSPDVISENVLHTSLVCSARVSETERHCYVAIIPNGVMNEVASWSDSFIFIWWYPK